MAEKRTTGQESTTPRGGKEVLQHLHDQGVIDLDAPMRQLFDKMEANGDVSGYRMISAPEGDQWWVYESKHYTFAGDEVMDLEPGTLR